MFCLAVTILLRRADKSALVSLTIVCEGVKAKAAVRTHKIQLIGGGGGRWRSGNQENCLHLKQNCCWILLFGHFSLPSPGFYIQREILTLFFLASVDSSELDTGK